MISLDLSEDLVRVFTGFYSIKKDLPLQLCSIGVYIAAYNLIYRNQTIFDLIFYWGFGRPEWFHGLPGPPAIDFALTNVQNGGLTSISDIFSSF